MLSTLTPDNIHKIKPLKYLGRGEIKAMAWLDEDTLAVASTFALWHYMGDGLEREVFRFEEDISHMKFSDDHKRLIAWNSKKSVYIYDTHTGIRLHSIKMPFTVRTEFRYTLSHDYSLLAVIFDNGLHVFDTRTGARKIYCPVEKIRSVKFDNRFILLIGYERIFYFDIQLGTISHEAEVTNKWSSTFHPDYRRTNLNEIIVYDESGLFHAVCNDKTIQLCRDGQSQTLNGHQAWICGLMFVQDIALLISVDYEETLIIWDMVTGSILDRRENAGNRMVTANGTTIAAINSNYEVVIGVQKFPHGHYGAASLLHFNGDHLTSVNHADYKICLWNWVTGQPQGSFYLYGATRECILSPDARLVTYGDGDWYTKGEVSVVELETSTKIFTRQDGVPLILTPNSQSFLYFADASPRQVEVALSGGRRLRDDSYLQIFKGDLETGSEEMFLSLAQEDDLRLDPACRWYVRNTETQGVSIFDFETHKLACMVYPTNTRLLLASFSPDGKYFATVSRENTSIIEVWEIKTGSQVARLNVIGCSHLMFSPDSRLLIAVIQGEKTEIWLWNMQTKTIITRITANGMKTQFCNSSMLAITFDDSVELRRLDNGRQVRKWSTGKKHIGAITFSTDSKLIAISNNDGTIGLWGVEEETRIE